MLHVRRCHGCKSVLPWRALVFIGLAGLIMPALGLWKMSPADAQQTTPPGGATPPAAAASPLEQPLQWLYEARKFYGSVRDYTCTLVKQENIQGNLTPQNIILMKFRSNPFSVNMRWLSPTPGQEVSFIYGRNGNQMRVNIPKGLKKVVGFVSVDPFDRRVMQQSRHNIYEAGIGNLIEQTLKNMEMEKRSNKTQVRIADYSYNKRPCWRVESTRLERGAQYYSYRSVLFIDKEWKLPIRTENYDWPYQGGSAGGDLLETFSFVDLRFNVGLTDADFVR